MYTLQLLNFVFIDNSDVFSIFKDHFTKFLNYISAI